MNDITVLSPEKLAEIRQRYSPKPIPKCRICGAEMSIGAVSASRTVYACSGATHDENGWHYAPGRSLADDHYSESRVTVVDVSDPDVLALVEALEKAQQYAKERDEENQSLMLTVGRLRVERESLESRTVTVKLPELCVGVVQGGHAVMVPYAAGHWFNKTAILEMLAAAGIQVIEGDA